jgi:flagellar assembly protein FliH
MTRISEMRKTMATVEEFRYPVVPELLPLWDGVESLTEPEEDPVSSPSPEPAVRKTTGETAVCDGEIQSPEQVQIAFERGRQQGVQEGRLMEREAQKEAQAEAGNLRFRQAAALAEEFAREREQYLLEVEREVVKLALAIAQRILRREAQMDPLLLTGAVRVALGQLSKSTRVRLRVPPADLDLWSDAMAHIPNLVSRPEVVSGEGMLAGQCVLETEIGSVDLGIRSQLDEIEQGFFDGANSQTASAFAAGSRPGPQVDSL